MRDLRRTRVEDYLCAIEQICNQTERDRATTGHVARVLEVSKGTASSSLKQLAEDGLIDHVPYDGVSLTAEGRALAQRTVTRRRLMQLFLTNSLGSWDAVEEEAARLELAASDELIERLDNILGRPCFDPRGAPISRADRPAPLGPGPLRPAGGPSSRA